MQEVDYIIVGQGLAGSAIAVQCLKHQKKILVIDQPSGNTSSRVAAGLFNPITGKKMVKTWLADTLFPYLHQYYRFVETQTEQSFFHSMPLYRPFVSIEEQNEWMARSADAEYQPYIDRILTAPAVPEINDPYGGLWLKQCGFLDTTSYTNAVRQFIQHDNLYWDENFQPELLQHHDNRNIVYKQVKAKKIILCQGVHSSSWFKNLPVRPLKGETITIQSNFKENVVVNRGVYVVPAKKAGDWRIGSTYNFQDKDPGVTTTGRIELVEKLSSLASFAYTIIDQAWGFRPTTPDRRPILGAHRDYPAIIIFNGLGTKGVSLAPYFSEVLFDCIENQTPLDKLVDIGRYKSVY